MQHPVGNLYFAGEATDADYNGFVLGGYHSGQVVAKRILKDMTKHTHGPGLHLSSLEVIDDYPAPGFQCSSRAGAQLLASIAAVAIFVFSLLGCCFGARSNGAHVKQHEDLSAPMLPKPGRICYQLKV